MFGLCRCRNSIRKHHPARKYRKGRQKCDLSTCPCPRYSWFWLPNRKDVRFLLTYAGERSGPVRQRLQPVRENLRHRHAA